MLRLEAKRSATLLLGGRIACLWSAGWVGCSVVCPIALAGVVLGVALRERNLNSLVLVWRAQTSTQTARTRPAPLLLARLSSLASPSPSASPSMSAAGLAELGLPPPIESTSNAAAGDIDMVDIEAVKAEEAQPKDLYTQLKECQSELEFLRIQENYIK